MTVQAQSLKDSFRRKWMEWKSARLRPVHLWWLGVALFTPSVIVHVISTVLFASKGMYNSPLDWQGIRHNYLPFIAAVVGFTIPLVCLRYVRFSSIRPNAAAFSAYLVVMLIWGIVDIRNYNWQIGGHDFVEGELRYFHQYTTWYFLPYRWIEHW